MKKEKFTVDCSADPLILKPCKVRNHDKGSSETKLSFKTIGLLLAGDQHNALAEKVYERLKKKKVRLLNANVLDFLLKNQVLIPDSCKELTIVFWGTIYEYENGELFVRTLSWIPADKNWACRSVSLRHNYVHLKDVAAVIDL
jgi:hypothetical protein